MKNKHEMIFCSLWITLSLILVAVFSIAGKEQMLMAAIVFLLCALGTSIGRLIKNNFPYIRKYTLIAAIVFSLSTVVFAIICFYLNGSISAYTIITITALGALSALIAVIVYYYRQHNKA